MRIKYFTDEVIIDANGNKIQKFAITDKRQQKWNYSSILSVMMQNKQTKIRISAQQETILNAQTRVDECQNEIEIEKIHQNDVRSELDEIDNTLSELDTKIVQLKERIAQISEESKKEMSLLNDKHTELYKKKNNLAVQLELSNNRITNKMSELSQRNMKVNYEQKSLQTILEQTASIKEMYELIAEALALTLAKR
jgi:chromosome segregation ATPase